jgi:hypothetical protein
VFESVRDMVELFGRVPDLARPRGATLAAYDCVADVDVGVRCFNQRCVSTQYVGWFGHNPKLLVHVAIFLPAGNSL